MKRYLASDNPGRIHMAKHVAQSTRAAYFVTNIATKPAKTQYSLLWTLADICRATPLDTAHAIMQTLEGRLSDFGDKAYPLTEAQVLVVVSHILENKE